MDRKQSFLEKLMESFLGGNLTILLILIALVAGAAALMITPREEEPQIVVPLADVIVMYPGGSAEEVEKMVASRLERLLYQIDGVEYVYSMSRPGMAVVTVRFFVGQDREGSLVKLYNKIEQNLDMVTPGIAGWLVKPVEIDDVSIINATLYSATHDTHDLYRVAEEVVGRLQNVKNTAAIKIYGGEKRVVHVYLDPERLMAFGIGLNEIAGALQLSNSQSEAGEVELANSLIKVATGEFLHSASDVANLMVGIYQGKAVYLRDVAKVEDGPDEITTYTRLGFGPAAGQAGNYPAVTISIAKKKGANAVQVAQRVQAELKDFMAGSLPADINLTITRDYGMTANDKVNSLVMNLVMGLLTVVGLIALAMSWREGLIVGLTIPITYALSLFFNYLFGYTINRVTLFALILAMGMLVDNPIVSVENIYRYLGMKGQTKSSAVSLAMREILRPMVLATLAIIVSFLPMFFITGMMGPYMAPMALNLPLTMICSMLVAIMVTPWLASKILKERAGDEPERGPGRVVGFYSSIMRPLVNSRRRSWGLLGIMLLLFLGSISLAATGLVPLKMLPFDNKDEFQLLIDMPEGTTLEETDAVSRELEAYVATIPEVLNYTTTVGAYSPMDFNGLVRHYYLRQGGNVADLRLNLLHRNNREMSSHAIGLRIRNDLQAIGDRWGASIKLLESPPGPPVLSTLVAEVYGSPYHGYDELIAASETVMAAMHGTKGVVDIDSSVEALQPELFFRVDRDKAGLSGISTQDVVGSLRMALSGMPAGTLHGPHEVNELPIILRLPRERRFDESLLNNLPVKGRMGQSVPLGELGSFVERSYDRSIMHKNLERVIFVNAELAGRGPAYAVLDLQQHFKENPLPEGVHVNWAGEGEWKITLDVFRDLGIAFGVALMIIYILLVYETASYMLPLLIMLSIPLTMIGIMPGFWLLNLFGAGSVGGYADPVFFTATAMIGMIALGGIVQRNAIILIDFIRNRDGGDLKEVIVEAGAVRLRPIMLTAGTTMLGVWPITFDPIFSGLGWSIIFGLFVSTVFTLVVIPLSYNLLYGKES